MSWKSASPCCKVPNTAIVYSLIGEPLSVQQAGDAGHLAGGGFFGGLVGPVGGDQLLLDGLQCVLDLGEVGAERLIGAGERGRRLALPATPQLAGVAVHARLQSLDDRDRLLDLAGRA